MAQGATIGGKPLKRDGKPSYCCCDTTPVACACVNVPAGELPASVNVNIDAGHFHTHLCCCINVNSAPLGCCDNYIAVPSPVEVPYTSDCEYYYILSQTEAEKCLDPEDENYPYETYGYTKIEVRITLVSYEGDCYWQLVIRSNCGDGNASCGGADTQYFVGTMNARDGLGLRGPLGTYTRVSGVYTSDVVVSEV